MVDEAVARPGFADRVAARAVDVKFAVLLLSLIALPFYVLGVIAAVVWLALRWAYSALLVGFDEVTKRGADAG